MAEQSFTPNRLNLDQAGLVIVSRSSLQRQQVSTALGGGSNRLFGLVVVHGTGDASSGQFRLAIAENQSESYNQAGEDLSVAFETKGSITVEVRSLSVTVSVSAGMGGDSEPYVLTGLPNAAAVTAFADAVRALNPAPVAGDFTVTLRDTPPPTEDHSVDGTTVSWAFATSQPTPEHVAYNPNKTADGTAVGWDFATSQPDPVSGKMASGTAVAWDFATSEPDPVARRPLSLDYFTATGAIHMQMRITAGHYTRGNGQENLWASSLWTADGSAGQVGTLEEGSATVDVDGDTDPIVRRVARWDSGDRLILNSDGTGDIGSLFDEAGDAYRLSLVIQRGTEHELFTLPPPSTGAGGSFVDWREDSGGMTAAQWALVDGINSGDEIILVIHQGAATYEETEDYEVNGTAVAWDFTTSQPDAQRGKLADGTAVAWDFTTSQPAPFHTEPGEHFADGTAVAWDFATSEPDPQLAAVEDGTAVAWDFATSSPAPGKTTNYEVNGTAVAWDFTTSQPAPIKTTAQDHEVDGTAVGWSFATSRPRPTSTLAGLQVFSPRLDVETEGTLGARAGQAQPGIGLDHVWSIDSDASLPMSEFPDNDWGARTGGTRGGRVWSAIQPSVTEAMPYRWHAARITQGFPDMGDSIPAEWMEPALDAQPGAQGLPGPQGIRGVQGLRGLPGLNGDPGDRGPGQFVQQAASGTTWATFSATISGTLRGSGDAIANAITGHDGGPLVSDVVTIYRGQASETRTYTGFGWVTIQSYIHGNLLVSGTIIARHLASHIITADHIVAGSLNANLVTANFFDGAINIRRIYTGANNLVDSRTPDNFTVTAGSLATDRLIMIVTYGGSSPTAYLTNIMQLGSQNTWQETVGANNTFYEIRWTSDSNLQVRKGGGVGEGNVGVLSNGIYRLFF